MLYDSHLTYPTTKEVAQDALDAYETGDMSRQACLAIVQLAERIEALEQQLGAVQAQSNNNESLIQLLLSAVLSTIQWAYAWCKHQKDQKDQKRTENFLVLGTALKDALATIEQQGTKTQ